MGDAWHAVSSPVVNTVKAAVSVVAAPVKVTVAAVKGENVIKAAGSAYGDAAKNSVSAVMSGNPMVIANNASGGKISSFARKVPLIGDDYGRSLEGQSGMAKGDFSATNVRNYWQGGAATTAKVGAAYFGGAALGGATLGGQVVAGAGTLKAGESLARGDVSGAAANASQLAGFDMGNFGDFGDLGAFRDLVGGLTAGMSTPSGNGGAAIFDPIGVSGRTYAEPDAASPIPPWVWYAAGGLLILKIAKGRK